MKYGIVFNSLGEAAEELRNQFAQGKYDKPRFFAAADLLFGSKLLDAWEDCEDYLECIKKALESNMQIFQNVDVDVSCFTERILLLAAEGAFVDETGRSVLTATQTEDGQLDMNYSEDDLDTILRVMQISPLVFLRYLDLMEKLQKQLKDDALNTRLEAAANRVGVSKWVLYHFLTTIMEHGYKKLGDVKESLCRFFERYGNFMENKDTEQIENAETTLNALNLSLKDKYGKVRDLGSLLTELSKQWYSYDNSTKVAIAKAVAGTRQIEDFLIFMENQHEADTPAA